MTALRVALVTCVLWAMVVACAGEESVVGASGPPTTRQTAASTTLAPLVIDAIPDEARRVSGGGDPRTPEYWAVWNSCAANNRADQAAANGGRDAGWAIMDDVLADPGVALGEHLIADCAEGLAMLEGSDSAMPSVQALAAQLLAAELNLDVGAETCQVVEEAAVASQRLLADLGYAGPNAPAATISGDVETAIDRLTILLTAYNTGELCR